MSETRKPNDLFDAPNIAIIRVIITFHSIEEGC